MSTTEIKLQNAISAFKNGKLPSQRAAASEFDVPLSTLNSRVTEKSSPRRAAAEAQQRLSKEQEDYLVRWIIQLDRSKEAPSHIRVREMAAKILEIGGDVKPLGKRWVNKFLTRHTQVKGMIGKPLDRSRVEASTQDAICQFYTLFENIQQEFQVTQENVWNMDEHGLAQGVCAN
ncbi:hypothetical protein K3495_g14755 [Podosphaera aphanis]|nr:hypothetical protein K3495_g14755 [Podosphaera aphanis]